MMRPLLIGIVIAFLTGLFLVLLLHPSTGGSQPTTTQPGFVLSDDRYLDKPVSYTVQGDSLQVVSMKYFLKARPNWRLASFSAKGGRRAPKALHLLRSQRLGQVVIISVGTNDWFRPISEYNQALNQIIGLVGPNRCLVMATIYDHGPIEAINQVLRTKAHQLGPGRMQLVHWAEAVGAGKVRLADGVHPGTMRDHRLRTQLLVEAAERCLAARHEI